MLYIGLIYLFTNYIIYPVHQSCSTFYFFWGVLKLTIFLKLNCLFVEICALLGYYAASCGNCLPTFRDNVSVPSSRVKSPSRNERKPETYNVDSGKYGGVAICRRDDSQWGRTRVREGCLSLQPHPYVFLLIRFVLFTSMRPPVFDWCMHYTFF
jgi:hypothetical protein